LWVSRANVRAFFPDRVSAVASGSYMHEKEPLPLPLCLVPFFVVDSPLQRFPYLSSRLRWFWCFFFTPTARSFFLFNLPSGSHPWTVPTFCRTGPLGTETMLLSRSDGILFLPRATSPPRRRKLDSGKNTICSHRRLVKTVCRSFDRREVRGGSPTVGILFSP